MKEILVVEMSEKCMHCELCARDTAGHYCKVSNDRYVKANLNKPDWCPLKPMNDLIDIDYLQKALVERLYNREISSDTMAVINQIIANWKRGE